MRHAMFFALALFFGVTARAEAQQASAPSAERQALAANAAKFYEAGDFQAAAAAWGELRDAGIRDADLEYSLGNTEFRLGNLGEAILHWQRARVLRPGDADIRHNLEFGMSRTVDKVPPSQANDNPILAALFRLHHWLGLDQQIWFLLGLGTCAALLAAALAFVQGRAAMVARSFLVCCAVVAAPVAVSAASKAWAFETTRHGVVVARQADVMSGPGDKYQVLHVLNEGTSVDVIEKSEGWIGVRLGDRVNGFVKANELGIVED